MIFRKRLDFKISNKRGLTLILRFFQSIFSGENFGEFCCVWTLDGARHQECKRCAGKNQENSQDDWKSWRKNATLLHSWKIWLRNDCGNSQGRWFDGHPFVLRQHGQLPHHNDESVDRGWGRKDINFPASTLDVNIFAVCSCGENPPLFLCRAFWEDENATKLEETGKKELRA